MQQVNTRYYSKQIAERYPDLKPEVVHQICIALMRQLYVAIAGRRFDVAIKDSNRNLKLKFYKRDHNIERANIKAQVKAKRLKQIRLERKPKK